MCIPIIDLKAQYKQVQTETEEAVLNVLRSGHYILGPEGNSLEQEIASYLDVKHALAVNSGTTALHLALAAAGVSSGDEVITTPFTFIATAEAISYLGAVPVFVDIDPDTYCMDPLKIKEKISSRTKAIIPVHLYGHSVDMDPIVRIASQYGLKIIEDCAQSIGTTYKGQKVGGIGDFGCFSFFPTKNLGAAGEGGLITTNNSDYYHLLKGLRVHGSWERYNHKAIGYNARLNEIQCSVLRVKLRYLDQWITKRVEHAAQYNKLLDKLPVGTPITAGYSNHVYHQYAINIDSVSRDSVLSHMSNNNISCAVHYPKPIHLQDSYRFLGLARGDYPISEKSSSRVLSLPVYPELTENQICKIVEVLKGAFHE